MDLLLLISCCLLLVLEEVIKEHAKLLNYFKDITVQEKEELHVEDILNNWGFNPHVATAPISIAFEKEAPVTAYEESQLNDSHTAFFQSLSTLTDDSMAVEEWEGLVSEEPEHNADYDALDDLAWESLLKKEADPDILSMSDWQEEPVPTSMDRQLSATATHKINDSYIGEQLWVVEVVGYEQEYIHVSDGATRTWLNIAGFNNIHQGDILSLLVERDITEHLKVMDINILQKRSNDFAIEIDDLEFDEDRLENVM